MAFPTSPSVNDTYTFSGRTWIWNGSGWASLPVGSAAEPAYQVVYGTGVGTDSSPNFTFNSTTGVMSLTSNLQLAKFSSVTSSGWTNAMQLANANSIVFDTGSAGTGRYAFVGATGADGNLYVGRTQLIDGTTAPVYSFSVSTGGAVNFLQGAPTVSGTALASTASPTFTGTVTMSGTGGTGHVATLGNDVQVHDIDVANVINFRGVSDATVAGLKLGSTGPTLYGNATYGLGVQAPSTGYSARFYQSSAQNYGKVIQISTTSGGTDGPQIHFIREGVYEWGFGIGSNTNDLVMYSGGNAAGFGTERVRFNTSGDISARDFTASRGDGTGVIYLNNAGNRYLYYNGTTYIMPGAGLDVGGTLTSGYFQNTGNIQSGGHVHTANGSYYVYSYQNVYAQGDIIAYYSDERLKDKIGNIPNALESVCSLDGFRYRLNDTGKTLMNRNDDDQIHVGLGAHQLERVLPEAVTLAPFDMDQEHGGSKSGENYLTVKYDRVVPLLVEAIKELNEKHEREVSELRAIINELKGNTNG